MGEDTKLHISPSRNELVTFFEDSNISLYIKREDLLHSEISGNKFRKLKYNLLEAKRLNKKMLLTFGGAFSNHISAVAAAGQLYGLNTVGIIRGEELGDDLQNTLEKNPTLNFCISKGMTLKFVTREMYRRKNTSQFQLELQKEFGDFYLLSEGGTNSLAIKGCEEILTAEDKKFNYICCPVGTGGTIAGIINSSEEFQKVIGFPALKGDFLDSEISKLTTRKNWELRNNYHFGGYGKISAELISFLNSFQQKYKITLDPVYTGKMFFGIFDLVKRSAFPQNSSILAIHTGGLQGIAGMNLLLSKKNLPLINV